MAMKMFCQIAPKKDDEVDTCHGCGTKATAEEIEKSIKMSNGEEFVEV